MISLAVQAFPVPVCSNSHGLNEEMVRFIATASSWLSRCCSFDFEILLQFVQVCPFSAMQMIESSVTSGSTRTSFCNCQS